MSLMNVDGQDNALDRAIQRQGFGTLGGEHMVPSSVTGQHLSNVITPLDRRVKYGGTWTLQDGINAYNFLSYTAFSSAPASNVTTSFTGSSIAIIGTTLPSGGRANVYIDGVLSNGALNTSTALSIAYYTGGGLNATDTTINVLDTSFFVAPGTIVIDAEEITYTGISGSSFTGCTRGVNGTTPAIHTAGKTLYAAGNNIEFYSPYQQDRITVWRKTNLQPGNHTLQLIITPDKNSSSTGNFVSIGGFILGGIMGASNVLTSLRYIDLQGMTTNSNGVSLPYVMQPFDSSSQLLTIAGVTPITGCNWAFPMYNATNDELQVVCDTKSGSGIHVVLTALYLGPSF